MKTWRLLSMATALLMIAFLAGCSGTPASTPNSTVSASSTGSASPAAASATPNALAPITLTLMTNVDPKIDQNGVMNDPVAQYIKEKTGITLDLTTLPDSGDSVDKENAMIASNDLPNIFEQNGGDAQLANLINAKEVTPLDDLVAQYAPNINADNSGKAMLLANKLAAPDGKLYYIGMDKGYWDSTGMGPQRGFYIRWDLYKQLGYPEIKTTTDLANVLAQMQKLEPAMKNGQKTYAAAAWNNGVPDSILWPEAFTMGYTFGPDNMLTIDIGTHEVSSTNALKDKNSVLWDALKFTNKLSQLGVFDPDTFTQTYQNYMDKCEAGQYLMGTLTWSVGDANKTFAANGNPEKALIALPSNIFGAKNVDLFDQMVAGERRYCIASTCKTPDRAIQLLDFLSTYDFSRIAYNGLEGANWSVENGVPTPKPEYLGMTSDQRIENSVSTGAGAFRLMCGYASATVNPKDNLSVNLLSSAQVLSDTQKDFVQHYGQKAMYDVYKAGMNSFTNNAMFNWGTLPDDLKTYETNLITYLNQGYVSCILAKSDADFAQAQDKLIQGLDAYKVDDIFKFYSDSAAKSAEQMKPIYDLLSGK